MTKRISNLGLGVVLHVDERGKLALSELSRLLVGQLDIKDAQRALRKSMSEEALARCNGSRSSAAALLGIDRRYVQRLANEVDLREPDTEPAVDAGAV